MEVCDAQSTAIATLMIIYIAASNTYTEAIIFLKTCLNFKYSMSQAYL